MKLRYINRTDVVVAGSCMLFILLLAINITFSSVIVLYIADIITLGGMAYWGIRRDVTRRLIKSLIIGGIVGVLYTFVDTLFVEVSIVTYLRRNDDFRLMSTPISALLFWAFFITVMMYLYQRLRSSFTRFYIPSFLTATSAFLLGLVLIYLGDQSRQWVWSVGNDLKPMLSIGPVPLYVPFAFFVTFLLSPYIIGVPDAPMIKDNPILRYFRASDNPLVGGIRCTVVFSASIYGMLQLFMRL